MCGFQSVFCGGTCSITVPGIQRSLEDFLAHFSHNLPIFPSHRLMTDPMTPIQVLQDLTNQELQADEEEKEAAAAETAGRR